MNRDTLDDTEKSLSANHRQIVELLRGGQKERAAALAKDAYTLVPKHFGVRHDYAVTLAELGRWDDLKH